MAGEELEFIPGCLYIPGCFEKKTE